MHISSKSGNSIAEFAVVIFLMAILISAGQVRFSQATESGKAKKSAQAINKIINAANNFYLQTNTEEGIGRFPGQEKWNRNVPDGGSDAGYISIENAVEDLVSGNFDSYQKSNVYGQKWCSVFGKNHSKAKIYSDHADKIHDDDDGDNIGSEEWLNFLDALESPYQDGHYIYTVIGGTESSRPALIVTDLFQPSAEFVVLQP
tara:strand:+ start:337 stop:942 length:606 start_codon:yes stop_codon:yes gene_type:complete